MALLLLIPALPFALTVVGLTCLTILKVPYEIEPLKFFAPLLLLPGVLVSFLAVATDGRILRSWLRVMLAWIVMTPISLILMFLPGSLDFSDGGGGVVVFYVPMVWGIALVSKWGPVILLYFAAWTWLCRYCYRRSLRIRN